MDPQQPAASKALLARVPRREIDVLELLIQAYTIADMAKALKLQPRTVKSHLCRLYLRFGIVDGCKNVKLAVRYYRMKHGIE